ncbi:DUF305 domain-containing protein [Streptosporangium sp. KLBMP 9127]|nr:DUF305 domain-containing protein [Streptosporangium sp. KLBMP 9127]
MSVNTGVRPLLITVIAAATLVGCTQGNGNDRGAPLTAGTGAPLVLPDAPGAQGRTATPGESLGEPESRPGAADVTFAESMIPHHRQALEMAALVAGRTDDRTLRAFATRISIAQGPEIRVMSTWLTTLGRAVPAGHDHVAEGYGMATLEQLNALRAARGTAFEKLFLRLMIAHHEGAVTMAKEELAEGTDRRMRLMAKDVASGQSVEISRMRGLLS